MDNGSLAIWYQWAAAKKGHSSRAQAEIHVNLWRRRVRRIRNKEEHLLDIGIKFRHASSVVSFKLFLPFSICKKDITDLGIRLKDRRTLMAIFNEAFSIREVAATETFEVCNADGEIVLLCHPLTEEDLTVQKHNDAQEIGTIVRFTDKFCQRFQDGEEHYIRFRLLLSDDAASILSFDQKQRDWALTSSFPRDEVVEFRFNERRSLPQNIVDEMTNSRVYETFDIKEFHYFLIRESNSQFIMGQEEFHKVRILENSLWSQYLTGSNGLRLRLRALIYHWKKVAERDLEIYDFSALAKFRRVQAGWTMVTYILIIVMIGFGGSLAASFAYERWFSRHERVTLSCPSGQSATPEKP